MSAWLHLGVVGLALALVGCGDGETPPEVETCPANLVAISGSASGQCEPNLYLGAALRGKHAAGQHSGAGASRGMVGERAAAEHHPITTPQPLLGVSYEVRVQRAGPTQSGTGLVGGGAVTFTR